MSGNTFGSVFRVTTFGESHGPALGVIIDGVPAGLPLTAEDVQKELDRRKPGQSILTTQRRESDTDGTTQIAVSQLAVKEGSENAQ